MVGQEAAEQAVKDLDLLIEKLGGIGPGKGGLIKASILMGVNRSTIKRYRNGTLTIPQSKVIHIQMLSNQDPLQLKSMAEDIKAGR